MNCRSRFLSFVVCLVMVAGCGTSEDTTNTVPQAPDPNGGIDQPLPTTGGPTDDRLPDWVNRTAPISLSTPGDYTLLEKLVLAPGEHISGNLVGDPLIAMELAGRSFNGMLYVAFEDKVGLAWREWQSLLDPSWKSGNNQEIYFMDSDTTVKTSGTISNGTYSANIFYRDRQPGETQCYPVPKCNGTIWNGYCSVPWSYEWDANDLNVCWNYMSPSNASVKQLGQFSVSMDKWTK